MDNFLDRQISLIGKENNEKIVGAKIALFGVGGVGSYVLEMFLRNGIRNILLCDFDIVDETNINRQLVAYNDTIGKKKVDVAKNRAKRINEKVEMITYDEKVSEDNIYDMLKDFNPDYIIDCIDDVDAKITIMKYAYENNIKCISSMGAGNRTRVDMIEVTDIFKTTYCPLAKKIRKILKKENIKKQLVVYSKEEPKISKKVTSIAEVPAVFGINIAAYVFNDILSNNL